MSSRGTTHAVAFATLIVLLGSGPGWAQKSCSDYYRECVTHPQIKNPQSCLGARTRCMKTGRYVGPETGRDYGAAEKK